VLDRGTSSDIYTVGDFDALADINEATRYLTSVTTALCYLCGRSLAPPTNADHPIMREPFAPQIRRKCNVSQLITLNVHQACNTAYKYDEKYFVRTLVPFARGSEAGNAIYAKVLSELSSRQTNATDQGSTARTYADPERIASLSGSKDAKRFQGERLRRVAWKIVRGSPSATITNTARRLEIRGLQVYAGEVPPPRSALRKHCTVAR
jgi:hypothetical protein